jgi:hypothetical protein
MPTGRSGGEAVNDFPRVRRPCDECPWRVDTEPGKFPACRYDALRETAGEPGREAGLDAPMFACHKTPDGLERACASWLAMVGQEHLAVRLAVLMDRLPREALMPGDDWPELFDSYEAMAVRQGGVR